MAEAVPQDAGELLPHGREGWSPGVLQRFVPLAERAAARRLPLWQGSGGDCKPLVGAAGFKPFSVVCF